MGTLARPRHGESTWHRENRFTGWVDLDLAPKGAEVAGRGCTPLCEAAIERDVLHTSSR